MIKKKTKKNRKHQHIPKRTIRKLIHKNRNSEGDSHE